MRKLLLVIVFFLFCSALAGTSFLLGQRSTTQKSSEPKNLLEGKTLEFFCSSSGCQQIGVKGAILGYDYAEKKISLLTANDQQMSIPLKEESRIDDQYGVPYFEETMQKGDIIYVIFDKKFYYAADLYFDKTGTLAKKQTR